MTRHFLIDEQQAGIRKPLWGTDKKVIAIVVVTFAIFPFLADIFRGR